MLHSSDNKQEVGALSLINFTVAWDINIFVVVQIQKIVKRVFLLNTIGFQMLFPVWSERHEMCSPTWRLCPPSLLYIFFFNHLLATDVCHTGNFIEIAHWDEPVLKVGLFYFLSDFRVQSRFENSVWNIKYIGPTYIYFNANCVLAGISKKSWDWFTNLAVHFLTGWHLSLDRCHVR